MVLETGSPLSSAGKDFTSYERNRSRSFSCSHRLGSTTVPYIEVYLGQAGASSLPQGHQVSRTVISIRLPRHLGLRPPLALLELNSRVEPSPSALPICLHPGGIPPGASCWVLGWKDPQDRGESPWVMGMRSDLRPQSPIQPLSSLVPVAAAVSILTPRLCHCLYQGVLPPGTFCVLYTEGQEDRCEVQGGAYASWTREGKGSSWRLDPLQIGFYWHWAPDRNQYFWPRS